MTPNDEEISLYNSIGPTFDDMNPNPRVKRQVAFPDDDATDERVEVIGDDENSVQVDVIEGRALAQTIQSVTKIDVGVQSQLFVAPGSTSILYFEVTNLRNEPTYHNFNVQDEKRFLRAMEPRL